MDCVLKLHAGTILHTGDWKIDPNPLIGDKINEKKLKEIGQKQSFSNDL